MSRIYDNKPLENLPVINIQQTWDHEKLVSSGEGVIIEGVVKSRSKFSVTDKTNQKVTMTKVAKKMTSGDQIRTKVAQKMAASWYNDQTRYYIIHTKVLRSHRRKFDSKGQEVEPNFSETQKVSTGYLNSSYKVTAKGVSDKLSNEELKNLIANDEMTRHTSKYLPDGCGDCLSLWLPESQSDKMEIDVGDAMRIKTEGNSPFIYSIVRMDSQSQTVSNYTGGDQVGASWTDKIMGMKSNTEASKPVEDDNDDEWDD